MHQIRRRSKNPSENALNGSSATAQSQKYVELALTLSHICLHETCYVETGNSDCLDGDFHIWYDNRTGEFGSAKEAERRVYNAPGSSSGLY